jgi:hypothetical protein
MGKMRSQTIARLAGFPVPDRIGNDDVEFRHIERIACAKKGFAELRLKNSVVSPPVLWRSKTALSISPAAFWRGLPRVT